ncbi:choice-of-anchor W domain-containing protein [Iningainema tapete]|uniref:PEP-CTERM sorting domain-containing protein n=1 Tax=Iningainema tapete BLCC-T55 TaxID=2748662 RepID=A0A8J7CB67_9CYAN|nr:choice-of-anchor W domain-containing protein [Iningainema tapete]MBD2771675.1 PEP-CTERM sorting domain-containing protein [Iningainema tapete BLCC-T55]
MISVRRSINYSKSLIVLGLATISLFLAPTSAKAFTLVNKTGFTDTDFNQLVDKGEFKELFVSEGRIGDRGGSATYELSINNDVKLGGLPVEQRQFNWVNGQAVDFSLQYTGSVVNYIVGGQTLSSTAFSGPVSEIFLRTFAMNDSTATLSNLVFDGVGIENLSSSATGSNQDVDYFQISNISTPFLLTGKTTLSWTGATPPKNSQLAYQIKVGNTPSQSVPEPGTVGAILLVTIAGVVRRKLAAGKA